MANNIPNATQARDALAWMTGEQKDIQEEKSIWEWMVEAIEGDFNDNRSTGQIVFDAAISMIPFVDQICDVRDLVANCKKLNEDISDQWAWVALALTLIGLFPSLGSLVKGVLKIFFLFVRRSGGKAVVKAVDSAMTWVITFLRKKQVQDYIKKYLPNVDILVYLKNEIIKVKNKLSAKELLAAFDRGIQLLDNLTNKAKYIPGLKDKIRNTVAIVRKIRNAADAPLAKALAPLNDALARVIYRLDMESYLQRTAVRNTTNVHFRGTLPEARAITLMRTKKPRPTWLSRGNLEHAPLEPASKRKMVNEMVKDGYPPLADYNIASFTRLSADIITGPARLYRVTSPANGAFGECWVTEEVFIKIKNSPDPKAAWRKYLAVWPDWNANGQFVIYDIPAGQSIKVWRGPASSQTKDALGDSYHLSGGWEQVIFKEGKFDNTIYYPVDTYGRLSLKSPIRRDAYNSLSPADKAKYQAVRSKIKEQNIHGPYDTNWGMTDFDEQLKDVRIGLPNISGQVINR
ncbi:hypothetical protein [Acinetobacter dispersus]|uniref:hypothetical protein n=1 Tax=Acinetobacter dispersus TaxID=70348 RepID=UPI00132EC5C0|nr:hypothetical protein [Acinetobacter dispersus]MCH7391128.1 hypothetical protein [Acinetobacter dispersus]QHH96350.1 hypothetical protein FPL17_01875 [Acinetobacter dispersus]